MVTADVVLDALGDASRRLILEHLAEQESPVGVLAARMPISRPAVSQHLRVLKDARLVSEHVAGTRRIYRVDPAGLRALRDYLDGFWGIVLHRFADLAEETHAASAGRDEPGPHPTEGNPS
ncbi:transcriptional regulator, ArsR family [Stackebrandtia albiflava]|uniref:Transcriptional regulator, ArsR family n=1 Tax=Stackebrandtia albiflava TaxID=406432 RepID=A0A562VC84_9ACTN|nr:metalloregulator ArsR/SmtB family transcription factor [Stackebrandtia albiflava]TWJ15489.1 transcriptional regulator, ArsR family [Stackebrandtia albiflava]